MTSELTRVAHTVTLRPPRRRSTGSSAAGVAARAYLLGSYDTVWIASGGLCAVAALMALAVDRSATP